MYRELVLKSYLLYLNARYKNEHWHKYYQQLKEHQWWSSDDIAALQLERLKLLLRHAYQNVPYYNRKFTEAGLHPDDIKTVDDLPRLPVLTREDVRENFSDLIAKNFPRSQMIPYATGGSTGKPLQFYISKQSLNWGTAMVHLAYSWYGCEWTAKMASLCGFSRRMLPSRNLIAIVSPLIFRRVQLDGYNMTESKMEDFVQKLVKFEPRGMIAYVSPAYVFAKYLKHKGISNIGLQAVITQAEKLLPHQRQLLEEVFHCEVFDCYGSREVPSMAFECPQHTGYHISTENVVLEFIRNNKPVSPGEMGKIVVTDLHNYAMPFIRYENGDLGISSSEKCPCGRGMPLMKEIVGRTSDIIIGTGGKYMSGILFANILRHKPWVKQFQVRQNKNKDITVNIVPGTLPGEKELESTKAVLQQEVGDAIKLDIIFVDSIAATESGKYRYTISEVSPEF